MFWKIIFFSIELVFEVVNFFQKIYFFFESKKSISKNKFLYKEFENQRVFIVGNGPSVNVQNLQKIRDEISIFVNMGFKHKFYSDIQPNYHVIVDPKLATGEWNIGILDKIIEVNPNVVLVLNSKWFNNSKFKPYKEDERFKIIWIKSKLFHTRFNNYSDTKISSITYGMGVLGASLSLALHLGFKKIILTGVESNAFCSEFENKESHFYGINEDNQNMNSEGVYKSLFFNYLYLLGLHNLSLNVGNIEIVNCTIGGILKMFKREKFDEQFN